MTPSVEEANRLLQLAARDFRTFLILPAHPEADVEPTCFHAQQVVEKAFKAVLTLRGADFRRTHDLEELALLLADVGSEPPLPSREYRRLNPFAVELRYGDGGVVLLGLEEAEAMARCTLNWAEATVLKL